MITDIRLQGFRSYGDVSFEFDPGVNIIVGPNASGKTNLLEAILVVAIGKSYRARDEEMLGHEAPWARIDVDSVQGRRSVKIVRNPGMGSPDKEFVIGDVKHKRLSLQKTLPIVLFEPNHLLLFTGSPEGRREFMDGLLEQTMPGFGPLRRQYKRTLQQRNALLKSGRLGDELFAWNIRLSQLGGQIAEARKGLLAYFGAGLADLYGELSGVAVTVDMQYTSSCNVAQYSSDMLHKLEAHLQTDLLRGFTGYGPHRDDMRLLLKDHPMEDTASRGETRTLLLALKILEMRLLEQQRDEKPLLLLDDVFSELDGARRRALTTYLSTHQTFITTTDADVVAHDFTQAARTIPLVWR